MFARRLLITAGTPGHMYLADRQEKCLEEEIKRKQSEASGTQPRLKKIMNWKMKKRI